MKMEKEQEALFFLNLLRTGINIVSLRLNGIIYIFITELSLTRPGSRCIDVFFLMQTI